jgi:GDPmannose 4,6-dehydratase
MKSKTAFITGITGQDGSYLAEFLLNKNYVVHGLKRRSSSFNTERIDHLIHNPQNSDGTKLILHYGDLTDSGNLLNIINKIQPSEIYNLAAQSHVAVSFETPEYTANVNGLGALRILEAIRILGMNKNIKFYQASTSELFGLVQEIPQNEKTKFYPRSPYAVSKLFAYWTTLNYREAYDIYACNGILFNHESKRRGETFVTRKITRALSKIVVGLEKCLYVGNLDSLRDWGHAKDYVEMQWLMLQQSEPEDYVIATGNQISVRDFIIKCGKYLGITIEFSGEGVKELGTVVAINSNWINKINKGDVIVKVDSRYLRPSEVDTLLGDATKARIKLGWTPKISIEELISEMIDNDLMAAKKNAFLIKNGY